MKRLPHLFENNRAWARDTLAASPDYFERLSAQQAPRYLWIGCADSRVPANMVTGTDPGEMFVHRNVANVVTHTDVNCLSVLQYAVEVLKVRDVIVCGHYGCGGVLAAMGGKRYGLIDNWLRHIKDVYHEHRDRLDDPSLTDAQRADLFCELNVSAQVANVCHTTVVQDAWSRGHDLAVHGWIYGLGDGLLKDLGLTVTSSEQLPEIYRMG